MTHRAKGWLLAGLLVFWASLLAIRVATYEEPVRTPLAHRSGQALVKTEPPAASSLPEVAKAPPPQEKGLIMRATKNIFAPLGYRFEVAELRDLEEGAGQMGLNRKGKHESGRPEMSPMQAAVEQARAQQEQAAEQARQRMAQYRFIGYLSQNGEPSAFLGKGTELYIVRTGEALEGQIHVAAIETTLLKLRDAASDTESSLPLAKGGQPGEPLFPSAGIAPAVEPEHP